MAGESSVLLDDAAVRRLLREMRDRTRDLTPAWLKFERVLARANRRRFLAQGASDGAAWAPLSPRYAAWKANHYPGKTILRRTDELFRSLTRVPMDVHRVTPSAAEFGTDVPYAIFHQLGTKHMPARPPVVVTPLLERELNRLVAAHVVGD